MIESLNYSLRRVLNDATVLKLLYLAIGRGAKRWAMSPHNWPTEVNCFIAMFGEHMVAECITQKSLQSRIDAVLLLKHPLERQRLTDHATIRGRTPCRALLHLSAHTETSCYTFVRF